MSEQRRRFIGAQMLPRNAGGRAQQRHGSGTPVAGTIWRRRGVTQRFVWMLDLLLCRSGGLIFFYGVARLRFGLWPSLFLRGGQAEAAQSAQAFWGESAREFDALATSGTTKIGATRPDRGSNRRPSSPPDYFGVPAGAMVLRFLSRTPLRHLVPRDTPAADSACHLSVSGNSPLSFNSIHPPTIIQIQCLQFPVRQSDYLASSDEPIVYHRINLQ